MIVDHDTGTQRNGNAPATKASVTHAGRQPSAPRLIPIGRRFEHGTPGEAITLEADLLRRHVAILAGPGSGKTVLLRRIVEEATLLGIPSIAVDINNDLARLGDRWPARRGRMDSATKMRQKLEPIIIAPTW